MLRMLSFSFSQASLQHQEDSVEERPLINQPIGSLHNDDGDGYENGKKAIGLDKQSNNFACASRFFVHFSAVVAWPQCETA